jgi:ATP-dependent Clp protease ATP-binding subunit ClpX
MKLPKSLRCSFCHKRQDKVGKLISNPPSDYPRVYVCDECIAVCNSILDDDRKERHDGTVETQVKRADSGDSLSCSFCRKSQDVVSKLISNASSSYPRVYVCDECIAVCNSILNDDGSGPALHFDPPNGPPRLGP